MLSKNVAFINRYGRLLMPGVEAARRMRVSLDDTALATMCLRYGPPRIAQHRDVTIGDGYATAERSIQREINRLRVSLIQRRL